MKNTALLFLLTISIMACGQINKTIIKANAYYTIPTPGTIMVDGQGKQMPPPRNKVYTVYLEIKGQAPQWTRAWVDGKSFTLTEVPVSTGLLEVGKRYADEKKIVLKASKQNTLLQIELSPDEKPQPAPQKVGGNELFISGKLNGKPFYYKISGITELASPEYQ